MRRPWPRALLLILVATGCSMLKPDEKTVAFGRQFLHLVEAGDSSGIIARVDPSLTSYTAWTTIVEIRDSLNVVRSDSATLIGWSTFASSDSYRANLTFELHGLRWALLAVQLERHEGKLVVTGLHMQLESVSLAEANAFHLAGKPLRSYAILLAAILSCLFSLGAAIVVARTRLPRRWLWTFIALSGYGQVALNWSTGETGINLLRVQLFGAGFVRDGYAGPWIISFALPLGAAYALWRRRLLTQRELSAPLPPASRSPSSPTPSAPRE